MSFRISAALAGAAVCVVAAAPARAAVVYQFTTANSSTAPNDDGYVAGDVSIVADPNVAAPTDGTELAAGAVGLSRFWNSEFAGFSLASANGPTIDNATEFGTGYFSWTVTATAGNVMDLTSLDFGSAVGGSGTRGFKIYAEADGGTFDFDDTPVFEIAAETGTRTNPVARSADLSGFQGVGSVTFRYYSITPGSGNTIDFSGMTLNGAVVPAVPEPGMVGAFGIAAVWMLRRRR
ncbi:MAG: PEP-CTERM sorting domain-containing protein [Phycisphaerae bacterium]|nr:PEP-CTERM sorting domain-containing protein [Tepidisphaeraceae bacterium]